METGCIIRELRVSVNVIRLGYYFLMCPGSFEICYIQLSNRRPVLTLKCTGDCTFIRDCAFTVSKALYVRLYITTLLIETELKMEKMRY